MTSETVAGRADWASLFISVALAVATLAAFAPAFGNDFVNYDDPLYVTDNPHVKAGLSAAGARWAFTSTEVLNWHPLTWLSLQLDATLYGDHPWGYHLTNVLLHAANALLLFEVLRRMTGAVWRSGLVAALFALHPLHVESVAWVTERKDVLSTCFGLLALAAYLWYVERPGVLRYLPVAIALALSLMAKPMLVTLPALLLLLDYWPLGRLRIGAAGDPPPREPPAVVPAPASLRLVLSEKLPLVALAIGSAVMTAIAQHRGGAIESLENVPLGLRAANAVVSYVRYLGLTVWPEGLAPFYPYPRDGLPWWRVAAAAALLTVVTLLALAARRRSPYLAVGWLWFLGTLVPVIGLVQVGQQALADRYSYFPIVGLFLMAVWGLGALAGQRRAVAAVLATVCLAALATCAALTWRQTGYWLDSRTLWQHTLRVTSDNYLAESNLGAACLFIRGTPQEAEAHLREAVRIRPDYWRAWSRLGIALDKQGRTARAIDCYSRSLRLQPEQPTARNNLAIDLAKEGRLEEAIAELGEATRLDPEFAAGYENLAGALARAGRRDEAIEAWRKAIRLAPNEARYHRALGALLRERGDSEAVAEEGEAARLGGSR
jgi:Flp pilus assembly protein TadD